ncbi:MAG: hypothetical protein HQL56_13355 [Magnetococcales bacterium]|nr:hypothetical protein [Magnetococcales bacterium]
MAAPIFIEPGETPVWQPQSRTALVTLAIGPAYRANWQRLARASWQVYCDRFGFDLIVISRFLDASPLAASRSPAWQKLLILSQPWSAGYERLLWLDADILIRPHAPDIRLGVPLEKVGAVDNYAQLSPVESQIRLERSSAATRPQLPPVQSLAEVSWAWERFINHMYRNLEKLDTAETRMLNTGVMLLSPAHHRTLLETVYSTYPQRTQGYEQLPLSLHLFRDNLCYLLNPRFNWGLFEILAVHCPRLLSKEEPFPRELFRELLAGQMQNAWFLHFAGVGWMMGELEGVERA